MKEGKISSELLRSLVFNQIKVKKPDVILRPEIGEDCAAIEFGDQVCVLSTDPITGADKGTGKLAVHISCNDIASSGVEPMALMITIMAPVTSTEEDIRRVMAEAGEAAQALNVEIIGGHTEITSAVNRMVISTTAIGKTSKSNLVMSRGAKAGDAVIMTKWAGLEGTAILVSDKKERLEAVLTADEINKASSFIDYISVVPEGVLAGQYGATSMHDVTEGGILGACWEVAESAQTGIEVDIDHIYVHPITEKICRHFSINPYRLISSGCMLITAPNGQDMLNMLKSHGIQADIIGKIIEGGRTIIKNGMREPLDPPDVDELFNIK